MKSKGYTKLVAIILLAIFFMTLVLGIGNTRFSANNISQGLDLKGGVSIIYEADKEDPTPEEMQSALSLIRGRLDNKGYTEAEVVITNGNRLNVDIPGVENADEAVKTLGVAGQLKFTDNEGNVLLTGADVKNASKQMTNDGRMDKIVIQLEFTKEGQKKFAQATEDNIGKNIIISLDDKELSNANVHERINSDKAIITAGDGSFQAEYAEEVASSIRSGALPFGLNTIGVNNVGAKLGATALETGILAGIVGVTLVLIFMLVVYKAFGIAASISLILYLGLDLFFLNLLEITLTLPGIAGIVLSIGMAVDANVIIFERIKEEVYLGKSLRSAVKSGFSRAVPAVLDGNITTLIAGVILFWLGSGAIKGFAQTLSLGIMLSMFTALIITKLIVTSFVEIGFNNIKYYGINREQRNKVFDFKFASNRAKYFKISAITIALGLIIAVIFSVTGKGAFDLDVEFAGGTKLIFDIGSDFDNKDIENIVKDNTNISSPQIQKIVGTNEVSIKMKNISENERINLKNAIYEKYNIDETSLLSENDISSTISNEMRNNAIIAVGVACLAMLIYVSLRFDDFKIGSSTIIALTHDAILVVLLYSIVRIPLNYSFIAAILTVLGYSINSTIVIFDRIRENKELHIKKKSIEEIIDLSVNQTLKRSIYTSITTLLTLVSLYIFGVTSVKEFSSPIIFGILVGTYSSVFLSSNIWYVLDKKFPTIED